MQNAPEFVVSSGVLMNEIVLSSWENRLWAWLIDVLFISLLWRIVLTFREIDAYGLGGALLLTSLLFIYWTAMEGYRGQSLGKMLLNISVTGPLGESIRFRDAAVESFGKAFLLPFDCLICWFVFRESRQRLFNRISNTIVIKQME
jgi:uncharacterized RDD family membrane protein YckC